MRIWSHLPKKSLKENFILTVTLRWLRFLMLQKRSQAPQESFITYFKALQSDTQILMVNFILVEMHRMNSRTNDSSNTASNSQCLDFLQTRFTLILCPQCYKVDVWTRRNSII